MTAVFDAPIVTLGNNTGSGTNTEAGPSALLGGAGFFDPRVGLDTVRKGFIGVGTGMARVLSVAPSTKSATNIAAAANAVSGTAVTLAGASTGITLVATGGFQPPGNPTVTIPAGALVLDGLPTLVNYGIANSAGWYINNAYNIASMTARCIQVTGATSGTGGNFLISGYDVYGYPVTQLLAATAGATVVATLKAFKFIVSITPQFSDAHTYSFGTTDVFGLPIRAAVFNEVLVHWNDTLITASTGFVAAVSTTATNLTGDVRGTYAVQSAADGTKRLGVIVSLAQANAGNSVGLFGVPQI